MRSRLPIQLLEQRAQRLEFGLNVSNGAIAAVREHCMNGPKNVPRRKHSCSPRAVPDPASFGVSVLRDESFQGAMLFHSARVGDGRVATLRDELYRNRLFH
jgi:hypothetical protein